MGPFLHLLLLLVHLVPKRKGTGAPLPPRRPRAPEGVREAEAWAAEAGRRSAFRVRGTLAGIAHVVLALAWCCTAFAGLDRRDPGWVDLAKEAMGVTAWALGIGAAAWLARSRSRAPLWGLLGVLPILGPLAAGFLGRRCPHCGATGGEKDLACPHCGAPVA